MSKLSSTINRLVDAVPENTSRRFNCPCCRGENSFSITKIGSEVKYNCFRNSCNEGVPVRGVIHQHASLNALKTRLEGHPDAKRPFSIPDYWIIGIASKKCHEMLLTTNSMFAYETGLFKIAYDPSEDRLCYLVQDERGDIVGAIGRTLSVGSPKTLNYEGSAPVPFIVGLGKTLVIVEDCASACSVASLKEYSSMPLLGTNLKEEFIPFIVGYDNIIVALDYDARKKALALKNKLCYYHKNVKMIVINKDFKDMTTEQIKICFN